MVIVPSLEHGKLAHEANVTPWILKTSVLSGYIVHAGNIMKKKATVQYYISVGDQFKCHNRSST